jgi:hypothetical protein
MKYNHKFEIGPNLSGLRIFKQLSIIGIFGVAFSLLSKGASLDANFIFGSFIIVIVIPCLISVISSFLLALQQNLWVNFGSGRSPSV